jgi:excisionase family DNA binding protein
VDAVLKLPDEVLDAVAERVLARLEVERPEPEPYLDVRGAAAYLACPTSRIYDLVAQRAVRPARDGRRLLFRREWLDEALSPR